MIRPRRAAILASCGCPCVNSAFLLGMLGEGGAGPSAGNLKGPSERGGGHSQDTVPRAKRDHPHP